MICGEGWGMDDANERYFPQHKLKPDIGLAEYNFAVQKLSSVDQSVTWTTNVITIIATLLGFAAFRLSEWETSVTNAGFTISQTKSFVLVLILIFSFFSIVHISNLLKSNVFSERKIIVLRRMLGVSYGENTLVLPNWRIEGADNPFSIHLWPGFISYRAFPVWFICLASAVSIVLLGPAAMTIVTINNQELVLTKNQLLLVTLSWVFICLYLFRFHLREANENRYLWIVFGAARLLRVPLVSNFEQTIYQIRLSRAELKRLNTDLKHSKTLAVFIEDQAFYQHNGINWRGVSRAAWQLVTKNRRSGGSSITQQFCRSNFITRLQPTVGRKIVEMLLARWIESVWTKEEIIESYLSSVRFENQVYGIQAAYRHFFNDGPTEVKVWEAFVMIERLANIRGEFLGKRVQELLENAMKRDVLTTDDSEAALRYYRASIGHHFRMKPNDLGPDEVMQNIKSRGSAPI